MNKDKNRHRKSFETLGKNIRKYREVLGISQEELAFRIYSARNYIGCIERAEKIPSVSVILDIALVLNCTFNDLFNEN